MNPKFMSGRFLLTVIAGLVFAWCACRQIISGEATAAILTAVFTSYFHRPDRARRGEDAIPTTTPPTTTP
jgi:hypothetical protein